MTIGLLDSWMTSIPAVRPLLPQKLQMQNYSFGPPVALGDNKKNYVFVDEHNRHKRLKVMRACEGCRRRKIKCDSATTNQWPCAACSRLKQNCVPPTVNYDRAYETGVTASGLERVLDFDNSSGSGDEGYGSTPTNVSQMYELADPGDHLNQSQNSYSGTLGTFQSPTYGDSTSNQYDYGAYQSVTPINTTFSTHPVFETPLSRSVTAPEVNYIWSNDHDVAANLSDVLGQLKITEAGIAPYISQQKKSLAEAPALEEYEVKLPPLRRGSGSTVRIPPELMPDEEQCQEYFDIFFRHIHPYVPVISKAYFEQQWRSNRSSISPLLLEAIFACAGRMSDDPAQGAQWLALASKHEDCFMDTSRLSTIQALLLLLKARESAPKRGYYYRSWMTVKTLVNMAKDLELHEHHGEHRANRHCGSDPLECLIKTRIWQNIFIVENMIGGPQGRTDMGVDHETVDVDLPRPMLGIDPSDYQISRQFTFLVRNLRNVSMLIGTYIKIRKQKDWAMDPRFINLNTTVSKWYDELPSDFKITYPANGAPPRLASHFLGNLHSYHHLFIIMLHRPQLMLSRSFSAGGDWKQHMTQCYTSAKSLCRLQEAILQQFGLSGLLYMQRGINFAIYCILTCTMIHLVAITSPDPEFSTDAKEYFTRHMRILEDCTSAWPMTDLQGQINALRVAFSADITKPFELKPSFPYSSPDTNLTPSPTHETKYVPHNPIRRVSYGQSQQNYYNAQPISPPISAGYDDHRDGLAASSLAMMAASQGHHQQLPTNQMGSDQSTWNPTRIFDQWDTAFGTPSNAISGSTQALPQPSPPLYTPASITSHDLPPLHDNTQHQQYMIASSMAPPTHALPISQQSSFTSAPAFISPSMWQDTVASTYDPGGLKRRWDMDAPYGNSPILMKRRG